MKRVYLVRHGESQANVERRHGRHTTPLTEKGRQQGEFIALRASKLPIEKIISSTMTRAQQTAEIISQKLQLPIQSSDLFVETRGPSECADMLYEDPAALEAYATMREHYGEPGFTLSDAEMFEDHTKRAQAALQLLSEQEENEILVVAHGLFLRILAAHVLLGSLPTAKECQKIARTLGNPENTSLTIFEYGGLDYAGNPQEYPWHLEVWNDHAHLAD